MSQLRWIGQVETPLVFEKVLHELNENQNVEDDQELDVDEELSNLSTIVNYSTHRRIMYSELFPVVEDDIDNWV